MSKNGKRQSPQASNSTMGNTSLETESTVPSSLYDEDDEEASTVATDVELKDSLERLDERSDVEKELFELMTEGQYQKAKQLIVQRRDDIDTSHKNLRGHDLLTHAVETKKKKMVSLVLNIDSRNTLDITAALLHAIKEGKMGIFMKLLFYVDNKAGGTWYAAGKAVNSTIQSMRSKHKKGSSTGKESVSLLDSFDQSEFGIDTTPLMQAAIYGHYEIMQVLYNRGERLPVLHLQSCSCSSCKSETRDLERTKKRIKLLRAMGNSTYMIFMACQDGAFDPVYEAIELMETIEQCMKEEPEYGEDYHKVLEEVKKLPVDLMDMCRTTDETKILLCQEHGYTGPKAMPYPRLALAIEKKHKEFVSHPNVQFFMQTQFHGPHWHISKNDFERTTKFIWMLLITLLYPLVQIALWLFLLCCCCDFRHVQFLLSPMNRALCKLGSQIWFCGLLLMMNMEERSEADNEPPTMYVRYMVIVWAGSQLFALIRRLMLHPKGFHQSGWNNFDVITQLLLWTGFGYWVILFLRKRNLGVEVTISRKKLPPNDPMLIGECIFALASTFSTLRILRWYILSPFLGPFQAGLHRMAEHIKTIFLFMAWTVLAFTLSSDILFRPYLNTKKLDPKDGRIKDQPKDFTEIASMMVDYFGGEIGPDQVEIFPTYGNFTDANNKIVTVKNEHETTQLFTRLMCLLWNIVGISFLKETVTGVFGSTGQEVLKAKDVVWKFERAKEMLYYIQDGNLAPPFNLLPHGNCVCSTCSWIKALTCGTSGRQAGCNCTECFYLRDVETPEELEKKIRQYPWLLRNLFQRYFKVKKDGEEEEATKDEVEEVEEEMKETRELCQSLLGKSIPPRRGSSGDGTSTGEGPSGDGTSAGGGPTGDGTSTGGGSRSSPQTPQSTPSKSIRNHQHGSNDHMETPPSKTTKIQPGAIVSSMQTVVSPKVKNHNTTP